MLPFPVTTLNVHHNSAAYDGHVYNLIAARLVLEPLASIDPQGQLVPMLAAEIPTRTNGGISADLKTTTWKLRPDVLWSDGSRFTADDVVFTWQYCHDQQTGCLGTFVFKDVA